VVNFVILIIKYGVEIDSLAYFFSWIRIT